MHMSVKSIEFASVPFFYWILDMFRHCGICWSVLEIKSWTLFVTDKHLQIEPFLWQTSKSKQKKPQQNRQRNACFNAKI